jgi:hypothetical protein
MSPPSDYNEGHTLRFDSMIKTFRCNIRLDHGQCRLKEKRINSTQLNSKAFLKPQWSHTLLLVTLLYVFPYLNPSPIPLYRSLHFFLSFTGLQVSTPSTSFISLLLHEHLRPHVQSCNGAFAEILEAKDINVHKSKNEAGTMRFMFFVGDLLGICFAFVFRRLLEGKGGIKNRETSSSIPCIHTHIHRRRCRRRRLSLFLF